MARDLNKVQITGRLGASPEMRYTAQGSAITTFRVASNRSWRNTEGETHEETEWFRVVAWDRLAEVCNEWLDKGVRVYVEGRLQTRQWQNQEGQRRSMTEVVASDLIILDRTHTHATPQAPLSNTTSAQRTPPHPKADKSEVTHTPTPKSSQRQKRSSSKVSVLHHNTTSVATPTRKAFEEEDLPFS